MLSRTESSIKLHQGEVLTVDLLQGELYPDNWCIHERMVDQYSDLA